MKPLAELPQKIASKDASEDIFHQAFERILKELQMLSPNQQARILGASAILYDVTPVGHERER